MEDAERFLRLPEVLLMTGRGRTATLVDVKEGSFPRPIKVGSACLWSLSDIQAWIKQKATGTAWAQTESQKTKPVTNLDPARSSAINAQRERIATQALSALIARTDGEIGAGTHGKNYAAIACDFAESLIAELSRRRN